MYLHISLVWPLRICFYIADFVNFTQVRVFFIYRMFTVILKLKVIRAPVSIQGQKKTVLMKTITPVELSL